jgi:hypothetical protein
MTHCRRCGVIDEVGESVICEDCADKGFIQFQEYYSGYDITCAALVLGMFILAIDIAIIIIVWNIVEVVA